MPIRATAKIRPTIIMPGWSLAAPATARTLSRLIDTSATATAHAAAAKLLAAGIPLFSSPNISSEPADSVASLRFRSRYIFHATQIKSSPPTNIRPMTPINMLTINANTTRKTSAAITPMKITFLRCSGGNPAANAPTTMALSPANTKSSKMTEAKAVQALLLFKLEKSLTICPQISAGPPKDGAAETVAIKNSNIITSPIAY